MIVPSTEPDLTDKRGVLRLINEGENRKEREFEDEAEEREENPAGFEDLCKRETVKDCRD